MRRERFGAIATEETVVLPLRRTSGGRAVVLLTPLARGAYLAGFSTQAPGHGAWNARLSHGEAASPNRYNAVLAALVAMRAIWDRAGVPAMVEDLNEVMDEYAE